MIAAVFQAVQPDQAIVHQLEKIATAQITLTVLLAIMALTMIGVAIGALMEVRRHSRKFERSLALLGPRVDPILISLTRIADDAEDISGALKYRLNDILATVEDLNNRLRDGADSVEMRVRKLGTVVDVVQTEAEEILLDAASAARGVHTASQILRSGRAGVQPDLIDEDEELLDDDEELDEDDEEYMG